MATNDYIRLGKFTSVPTSYDDAVLLECKKCDSQKIDTEQVTIEGEGFDMTWKCTNCGESETHFFEEE